ncbi:hypothetical protein GQX74_004626 [Glossina fuscipes]|nr:hypothetical protein GQX74_004626 [Glossina fuscipes]
MTIESNIRSIYWTFLERLADGPNICIKKLHKAALNTKVFLHDLLSSTNPEIFFGVMVSKRYQYAHNLKKRGQSNGVFPSKAWRCTYFPERTHEPPNRRVLKSINDKVAEGVVICISSSEDASDICRGDKWQPRAIYFDRPLTEAKIKPRKGGDGFRGRDKYSGFKTLRANSITAACSPMQMPSKGLLFSRHHLQAIILPSMPREPNPPGTTTPSLSHKSSSERQTIKSGLKPKPRNSFTDAWVGFVFGSPVEDGDGTNET